MAIRVRFETRSLALVCLVVAVCLAAVRAMPQDKSASFPTENEILDNIPKLAPFHSDAEQSSGGPGDLESTANRALMNKLVSLLEQRKMKVPANWIIHQALSGQHKRQIRYQQCYFNPISCF